MDKSSHTDTSKRPVHEAVDLLQISSEHRLRAENLPFDIDVWYPILSQFTFPSAFLPLTRDEATAIIHYQDTRFNERIRLTNDDITVLRALEDRIDYVLRHDPHFRYGAFLRLCGRSPKDGEPFDRRRVVATYEHTLKGLLEKGEPLSANTKLRAIAQVSWLKVRSGKEALSLLLTSERVFADMHDWIRYGEPEQIVLRQFEPELSLEYEFRAYVYEGQITGISQYDHYCYYPDLAQFKDEIQEKIFSLWKEIHPHVGVETYVIDFAYLKKSKKIKMIELSPYRRCTGAALFNWSKDEELLKKGPFEFRLRDSERNDLESIVEENWEQRWKKHVPLYSELYKQYEKDSMMPTIVIILTMTFFAILIPISRKYRLEEASVQYRVLIALTLGISLFVASYIFTKKKELPKEYLFVYGTLRKGYHWNTKFLSQATYCGTATTRLPLPLVVGKSGVPYLLGDVDSRLGKCVKGEIWKVDTISLLGLDEYEGVSKGYYSRRLIEVVDSKSKSQLVNVYFKTKSASSEDLLFLDEYTFEMHKELYKPIKHIQVKQHLYLGEFQEDL